MRRARTRPRRAGASPIPSAATLQGDKADEGAAAGPIEHTRPPPSPVPPPDPAKPYPTMSEQELFSDPRASLDKIAGAPPPGPRIDPSAALKGYGEVGPSVDEGLRDPFRPLGSDQAVNVVAHDPGAPPAAAAPSDEPVSMSTSIAPAAGSATGAAEAQDAAPSAAPGPADAMGPAEVQGAGSPAPSTPISAGARRRRGASVGRVQPARRPEEAARRRGQGDAGP